MEHKNFLKVSSITLVITGLVLLFGPRDWFPDYYNPVYMGIVALVSPALIYLPNFILKKETPQKRNLLLQMRSIIAFSLTVNIAGELGLFQLYKYGFEYDKFAHFIVNMLFAFILCEALKEWERLSSRKIIWLVLLIAFGAGLLWEVFEAASDYLFKTQEWGVYGKHLALDTYKDIGFNTLGALAGIVIFMIPKGKNKNHPKN
jgi:glycopeptide antibiotics resistance protein